MKNKLRSLEEKCKKLGEKLSDPELLSDTEKLADISRQFARCNKELNLLQKLEDIEEKISENTGLRAQEETLDPELVRLAEQEEKELRVTETTLLQTLSQLENTEEEAGAEIRDVIMEIRPGTGGEEAALFAMELLRMYQRFSERLEWKTTMLNDQQTDLGGLREAVFVVSGNNTYEKLRFEGGVHRVQRIPATEKSGRIHTSTATVAVLPKPRAQQMLISPQDIRVDVYRASGPGGQYVNKRESAVRITHLSSGIMVTSQSARTQVQNRENAMSVLRAKLLEQERAREASKRGKTRKSQIGAGDRSEKIRTYNFPQDRVTDHRVGKSWHNIERIMDGDLEHITNALIAKTE